jgi:hypothetical protein
MLNIVALRYISLSEINKVQPEVNKKWIENNQEEFLDILFQLGLDPKEPFDYQDHLQHRNFFNEIVVCDRVVGSERLDKEWLESGFASPEAKDKSLNSKLLIDLYRQRGMVDVE